MNSLITILTLIACLIITLNILLYIFLKKVKKINILINIMDFKQLMVNTTIAVTIGLIIQKIQTNTQTNTMKTFLDSYYYIISYLFIGIAILWVIEIFFYKNSRAKILITYANRLTYLMYTLILTLFAINPLLYINQIFCSVLWLILFYICKFYSNINYKSNDNFNERDDEPINDNSKLYKQRSTELEYIETYLQDNSKNNNCTISICADWGEGKTSFVNALKKSHEHKKDYVIFIQPMIMDSRKSLIDYFFSQMKFIMEKNSIYTGKGSSIDKYLNSLMNIINKDNKKLFDNLFNVDNSQQNDYRELKKNLQNDIDNLLDKKSNNKSIKILIDDFDRVEESVMYQILAFIKEVASFRGCTVIFLMDSKKIRTNMITYSYLDKFISKRFELKKIDREEIIKYYLDNKIYFNYENEDNKIIKEQYKYFRQNINADLNEVEECIKKAAKTSENIAEKGESNLEKTIKCLSGDSSNSNNRLPEEKILETKKKEDESNLVSEYIKNYTDLSSNPRKLKKLFRELEDLCKLIYKRYSDDSIDDIVSSYNLVNCNEIILRMSVLKIFFENEYDSLLGMLDIEKYIKVEDYNNIVKILFQKQIKNDYYEIEIKKQANIYDFINKNFLRSHSTLESVTEIKTKNKEILETLDNDKLIDQSEVYDILDILTSIYSDKPNTSIIANRLNKLEKYIEHIIDSSTMKFSEVLDILLNQKGGFYYSASPIKIIQVINSLIFKLLENQYKFDTIQEKEYTNRLTEELQTDIVFKSRFSIFSTLQISLNKSSLIQFNSVKQGMYDLYDEDILHNINKYAVKFLGMENNIDRLSDVEILEKWINKCICKFRNNQNIDEVYKKRVEFIFRDALGFVESLKLIISLREKIEKVSIKDKNSIFSRRLPPNLKLLEDEVMLLKENLSTNSQCTNIKYMYDFFHKITSEIYRIGSTNGYKDINEECLANLDYIFAKLNNEYIEEHYNNTILNDCALMILNIKTLVKDKSEDYNVN